MDTQQLLFENGTVWAVSTSGWTGSDRLQADDLGKTVDEIPDIFKLGSKYLIPDEWRVALNSSSGKVSSVMSRIGKPFFMRGAWFVPNKHLIVAQEALRKLSETQNAIVEDFLEHYGAIGHEMIQQYPVLCNATWPTEDQIRRKFKIRYVVFEVNGTQVNETDPEELIAAKRKFQAELKVEFDEYKNQILREAHEAIIDVCEELNRKIMETGSDKVTEATLRKPRRIIDDYLTIADVFDMDEIKVRVRELKDTLDSAQAKAIRDDWSVAKEFAGNLKALGDSIGDLSGYDKEGRIVRKVRKVA